MHYIPKAILIHLLEKLLEKLKHKDAPYENLSDATPLISAGTSTPEKQIEENSEFYSRPVRMLGGRERLRRELHLAHCCTVHGCKRPNDGVPCPLSLTEKPYFSPFSDCTQHPEEVR